MQMGTKILLFSVIGILVLILGVAGIAVSSYVSNADYGNRTEAQIVSEYSRAQNVLSSAATTVMDVASVNERYASDIKDIVQLSMSGRADYGADATVAFLQEQNINLDSDMYRQITLAITSGREDFRRAQNRVVDVKRSYTTQLGSLYSGFWLRMAGYPKIDLDDYDIIIDQSTRDRYATGVDRGFLTN